MLNKCPVSSYDQVCEVFKKELGMTPDKVCIFGHMSFRKSFIVLRMLKLGFIHDVVLEFMLRKNACALK